MTFRIDPLNLQTAVAQPDGRPTAEFMRQWQAQAGKNDEVDVEITSTKDRVTKLENVQIGGDGTHIVPVKTALSAGDIELTLPDQASVTPGQYGEATKVAQITVNAKGVITEIVEQDIELAVSSFLSYTLRTDPALPDVIDIGNGQLLDLHQRI